jgi:hypothetical protein
MQKFTTPDGHAVYTDGEVVVREKPARKREVSKITVVQGREIRQTEHVEYPVTEVFIAGTSFEVESDHGDVAKTFGHKPTKAELEASDAA